VTPEAALAEATRAMLLAARSLPHGILPGGKDLLTALVYLTDRSVGGHLPFESFLRGPHSAIVERELERAIILGQASSVIIRDGRPYDLIDGARTEIRISSRTATAEPGSGWVPGPLAARPALVTPARRMIRFAEAHPPFATTPWAVAAKLVWIRELDAASASESLESLAGQLRWANLDEKVRAAGVKLARSLAVMPGFGRKLKVG
jgi:hypothetical protein